jgi:hypothetical protein
VPVGFYQLEEIAKLTIRRLAASCLSERTELKPGPQPGAVRGRLLSNTAHAGVSHDTIFAAVQLVCDAVPGYDWNCKPGRWLTYTQLLAYTLLLALPFPAK